ncbi:ABC transporter permease [Nakamurella silvestris]|nr:ABC transporter permease [Nakamurella silvestris]
MSSPPVGYLAAPDQPWNVQHYLDGKVGYVLGLLWQHLWLSVLPVVIGLIIALPIGYAAKRFKWTYTPLVTISGLLYTIPSLALFVVIPSVIGTQILDPINVVIPLTIYTIALMVRVIADGLRSVDETVLQAASAMGYSRFQRLLKVELPIAIPVIGAGLRVAVVANVGMVAVAAVIGVPQLGTLFSYGKDLFYYAPIVVGLVLSVALAFALDLLIVLAVRALTPWRKAVAAR